MGSTMYLLGLVCLFIGANGHLNPFEELRSEFEFSESGTNLLDPGYRLDDSVYPTNMTVNLDVYLSESRFDGSLSMIVEVRESNLTQIVFHQKVVSILTVTVLDASNNIPVGLQFPNPFETDSYYEIIKINLAEPAPIGRYIINIEYTGKINENPIDRGFYKGYYFVGNEVREYATTQFQPYHARKAFPCFDEPQFKSQYVLTITRDSSLSPTFSNMDIAETIQNGNRVTERFYPTPIISAYLVAFHVSDFVTTNATSLATRPFQIISRQGVTDQHAYAAEIGLKITTELDDFLGIQYHEMGQGVLMKNDHIALPDFPSGAMENWGMVNYREAYLLYDPANTNLINKIFIATIMAHELGHKWFGNLVTCFWWSNLWLNESFASFFERFGAHYADPSLELADQFVTDGVFSALNGDASASIVPMNWVDVANQSTISGHFGTSSYDKGASVLRMLEHFVGERNFRNALRYYLRDNAYGIGTPHAMYEAFRKATSEDLEFTNLYPNIDIGTVFDSWVQNPGAPVVDVVYNTATGIITVSQQRFVISGTAPTQVWQIPISWTHSGVLDFTSTKPSLVLTQPSTTILNGPVGADNFVIFNIAHSGYYRVNYDTDNWKNIATFLRSNNREKIHKLSRAQIVNDVFYFLRSGKLAADVAFDVLSFLADETDYYVWVSAVSQFDWILRRLEHMPSAHSAFSSYILSLMDTVIKDLGYNESPNDSVSVILNRMQIMNLACNLGHQGCISDSLQKWNAHRENPSVLVPANLRRYVYCVGLREGDSSDYDFLYQKYNSSENTADMVVILRALGCTKDANSVNHYLQQSMYNTKIRIHDKTNAFTYALQGNYENRQLVYNFLYQNFESIREFYGGPDRLNLAINACSTYLTDFADIQQFQTWAYNNQIALAGSFNNAVSVVNSAINNLQWGGNNALSLIEAISNSAVTTSASFALLLVAFLVRFIY